jgi:imidazolonepropionase-like amidohydrolase
LAAAWFLLNFQMHGVDVIYHCDYADSEALDMLEAAKHRIFTGPAIGLVLARLESLRGDNTAQGRLYWERLKPLYEATCRTHHEMRKRGIVVGGDYGFAANPQGTNACDLEHFVTHFGFSPSAVLQAATAPTARSCNAATSFASCRKVISRICCWSKATR